MIDIEQAKRISVMLDKIQYEIHGGAAGTFWRALGACCKWVSIGALIHVGWRLI